MGLNKRFYDATIWLVRLHCRDLKDCIVGLKTFYDCNSSALLYKKLKTFNCGMQFIKTLHHKTFLSLNLNPQYNPA